jgi:hypothetical protein
MESSFVMYVCNIKLCLESYTSPAHLQKEPDFVIYVYNTIQFCLEAYTAPTHLQMEWWLTSMVWNITFSGISVNIVIVLRLDHMQFVSQQKQETYFLSRISDQPSAHLASCSVDVVGPSPPLKQLMHDVDHLSLFSAEVTDECSCNRVSPKCLQGQLYLLPLFWRNDSNIYMDIILSHRKWGRCGVRERCVIPQYLLCQNIECCYLIISIKHGSLETPVHVGFPSV